MKRSLFILLAACACTMPLCAAPPSFQRGDKATVLIFTTADCPIANALLPEVARLDREFSARGVAFTLVHVDPEMTAAKAQEHLKTYNVNLSFVLDPNHELVRQLKATRTPEACVLLPNGSTAYLGRINDLYHAPGQRKRAPTTNDLLDALNEVLAGNSVKNSHQPAVGCVIADLVR